MSQTRIAATTLGLSAVLAVMAAPSAHGAVLANFQFDGGSPASTDTNPESTAGPFIANSTPPDETSAGTGVDTGFSGTGNAFIRSDATGSTQAAALADDDFFSFTVSADAVNDRLDLSSLVFDFGGSSNGTAGGFTGTIFVQSDVTGTGTGGTVLFSESEATTNTNSTQIDNLNNVVDLSGTQFDSLSSITFQFRFSDNATASSLINRLDNVVLNGEVVAIPEPASLALLGLGGLMLLPRRQRA